jgi:hypothetical protein
VKSFKVRSANNSVGKFLFQHALAVGLAALLVAPALAQDQGLGRGGQNQGGQSQGGQNRGGQDRGSANSQGRGNTSGNSQGGYQGRGSYGGNSQGGYQGRGSYGGNNQGGNQGRGNYGGSGSSQSRGSYGGRDHNIPYSQVSRPSVADFGHRGADLGYLVNRGSNIREAGNYRTGYYHYNPGWHDRDWAFRGYRYDPFVDHCYVSPFAYYPFLPAYIGVDGLAVYGHIGNFFIGAEYVSYPYRYNYYNGYSSGYDDGYRAGSRDSDRSPELDRGVDEIVNAFQQQDYRSLDLLVGRRNHIDIFQDDRYSYSLESDAFYDLMRDNVRTAKTVRYEILNVRKYRDNAYVVARHVFVDPWGKEDFVYHTYKLHISGRDPQIVEFGTSRNEPRY